MASDQVRIVKLRLKGATRLVNVWTGCSAQELRELIGAAFGISASDVDKVPVALIATQSQVIVPLSVACAQPQSLNEATYEILLKDGTGSAAAAEEPAKPEPRADPEDEEHEARVAALMSKIIELIREMEKAGHLTKLEAETVAALASKHDSVILAAYAVASTDKNMSELVGLVRHVARDYVRQKTDDPDSFDGAAEHAAAEELLRVIDELYASKQALDMGQCRQLQRRVLLKDPVIYAALDVFKEDGDLSELFRTMTSLANKEELPGGELVKTCAAFLVDKQILDNASAERLLSLAERNDDKLAAAVARYGSGKDIEVFLKELVSLAREEPDDRRIEVLRECVNWLVEKELIGRDAARALVDATRQGEPFLIKAIDAYAESNDLETFLGTLAVAGRTELAAPAAAPERADDSPAVDESLAVRELVEFVGCLVEDKKLDDDDKSYLLKLVNDKDDRLVAAYDLYVETQDVQDLADTMLRVAKRRDVNFAEAPAPADVLDVFAEIAKTNLSDIEAAALQLCAARNDPDLAAVLQVFRIDGDKDDLQDSLKRIARKVVEATLGAQSPSFDDVDDNEDDDNEDDEQDEDDEDDEQQADDPA